MKRYILWLIAACAVLMALFRFFQSEHSFSDHSFTWWVLPLTFAIISLAGHTLIMKSFRGPADQFMVFFLLAVALKMFLYLGLLLIWFYISGQQLSIPFISAFAILYIVVTVIDLFMLLSHRKRNIKH